jgi:hypothetical protein
VRLLAGFFSRGKRRVLRRSCVALSGRNMELMLDFFSRLSRRIQCPLGELKNLPRHSPDEWRQKPRLDLTFLDARRISMNCAGRKTISDVIALRILQIKPTSWRKRGREIDKILLTSHAGRPARRVFLEGIPHESSKTKLVSGEPRHCFPFAEPSRRAQTHGTRGSESVSAVKLL